MGSGEVAQSLPALDSTGGQIKMATPSLKQPTAHANYNKNFNVFASKFSKKPRSSISFDDLFELAIAPPRHQSKELLPLLTPFMGTGKTKQDAERSPFGSIVIDHDEGNLSRAALLSLYRSLGIERLLAFTTWSSTPDDMRWKIVIPLSSPIRWEMFSELSQGICHHLGTDPAQARKQQGFHIPAMRPDYDFIYLGGPALIPAKGSDHPFLIMAEQGWQAIQAEQEKPTPSTARKPSSGGTIIQMIIDAYDLHQLLIAHGYKRVGRKYLSPNSQSKEPGISVLNRDGKQVIYSHHSESDPLATGKYCDVADVLCILEYGGDRGRMIREEASKLDPEGQAQQRKSFANR